MSLWYGWILSVSCASRRTHVVLWSLAATLWARAGSAQQQAQPHARVRLEYSAPTELTCPDREAFASAVATRLGYEPVAVDAGEDAKTLSVSYRREKIAIQVTLRLTSSAKEALAEKTLRSEAGACTELGAAAAFAAAIMLDPRAMFPRPKDAAPATPVESIDSSSAGTWPWYEPRSPIPPPAPPADAPVAPWMLRAGLGAGSCAGCAPAVSLGAALFFGVAKGRVGLDGGVRADLPAETAGGSGRIVSASVVVGELFPHARVGPARLGILGSVGSLFGESGGDKQTSLLATAGARAAFEWSIKAPVFLRAAVDASVVLSRVTLRVEGVEVWSTPGLTAGANLGGGVEF
jgi:hypothetical protein